MQEVSKLIDFDLVNLLHHCYDLEAKYKSHEDYVDEILVKSFSLGFKTKQKVLVFDMDETLICAKYTSKLPFGFKTTDKITSEGEEICVSRRPFVEDCLKKLSELYEIVVFTAGIKDYADQILNLLDKDNQIFKKRLYRTDCI